MLEIRPSLPEDFKSFSDQNLPHRVEAITVLVDGEIAGVGGLGFQENCPVTAFLCAKPEYVKKYPLTLHKCAKLVVEMARKKAIRKLVALADCNIESSERWLLRLGFKPQIVGDLKLFIWQE